MNVKIIKIKVVVFIFLGNCGVCKYFDFIEYYYVCE